MCVYFNLYINTGTPFFFFFYFIFIFFFRIFFFLFFFFFFFLIYTHVYIFVHISIQRPFFIISMQSRLAFKKRAQHAHSSICTGILLEHLTSFFLFEGKHLTSIERDVLKTISNDMILFHFQ